PSSGLSLRRRAREDRSRAVGRARRASTQAALRQRRPPLQGGAAAELTRASTRRNGTDPARRTRMGRLEGKLALISGGARGLGRAMAEEFVAEGARVMIGDVLEDTAAETAGALGERARAIRLDVTREESWDEAIAATVAAFGALNVLVNNAGTAEGSRIWE